MHLSDGSFFPLGRVDELECECAKEGTLSIFRLLLCIFPYKTTVLSDSSL